MATAATTEKEPTLEELLAKVADVTKRAEEAEKKLYSPDYSKVRTDELGRVTGFFEGTNESVDLTISEREGSPKHSYREMKRENRRLLKSLGYQPWNDFKSVSDFVRFGFECGGNAGKFESRLGNHIKAIQGMATTAGSDGGFTILPEFAPGIIDRVYSNSLFSMTDNYTVTGNNMTFLANAETSRATGSRHGGLQGYWMDEGGTITKSKPTVRQVTRKLHKLGVVVYLTDELIADSGMALQQYITRKASEEFNFMIGDSLVNGDGNAKPVGILNFPALISITKETLQGAATLQPENIVKMYARFFAPNLGNARWLHNQDIGPQLDLMTLGIGAAGIAVYMPPNGMADAPFGTLRGRPMLPTEFNPTLGTVGDLILGDMGQILSISKGGIAQAVSMHLEFLTDQLALRFTIRMDAGPWENAAITPYKGTNTQSNFIVLATRS